MPSFIGDIVGGVGSAIGSVVGGVVDAVGTVTKALGPIAPMAAMVLGMPYLAPSGFAALEAPSILAGTGSTLTGAGMLTSGSLGTALGTAGVFGGASAGSALLGSTGEIGSSLLSSAPGAMTGSLGTSSSFLTNLGRNISSGLNSAFGGASSSGNLPGQVGSSSVGSFDKLTKLIRGGMDIYNATQYGTGQTPDAAQLNADPYSPYRKQAADKLNELMQNPNIVYGMPGYKFAQDQGTKAINRTNAAGGNFASGNNLLAVQSQGQETAKNWFDDYVNKLSVQSGANQAPSTGQDAYSTAAKNQSLADKNKQTALLQGIMSTGSAIGSFFA